MTEDGHIEHSAIHQVLGIVTIGAVLASPFVSLGLQRWTLTGPRGSMVGLDRPLIAPLVTASLAVGLIHLAVISDHLAEDTATGLFFVVLAVFQVAWSVFFARQPRPAPAALGMIVNGAVILVWLVTHTVGSPFGSHPGVPEPIGVADAFATGFEAFIVGGTAMLAIPRLRVVAARVRYAVSAADLAVVMTLAVMMLTASYAMADIAINGGHAAMPAISGH